MDWQLELDKLCDKIGLRKGRRPGLKVLEKTKISLIFFKKSGIYSNPERLGGFYSTTEETIYLNKDIVDNYESNALLEELYHHCDNILCKHENYYYSFCPDIFHSHIGYPILNKSKVRKIIIKSYMGGLNWFLNTPLNTRKMCISQMSNDVIEIFAKSMVVLHNKVKLKFLSSSEEYELKLFYEQIRKSILEL